MTTPNEYYDELQRQQMEANRVPQEAPDMPDPGDQRDEQYREAFREQERGKRPEGFITELGEEIDRLSSGAKINDALNFIAPGIFKSDAELEAQNLARERQVAKEGTLLEKGIRGLGTNMEALSEGARSGLMMPLTITGRIQNEDTSAWSNPPANIADSPVSETIFEIMEIVAPAALMTVGGAGAGASLLKTAAIESAAETATQESAADLFLGESLSVLLGKLSEELYPGSGEAVVRELKEGTSIRSQALVGTLGFLTNLGINFSVPKILKKFDKNPDVKDVAEMVNKTPEEVAENLKKNVAEPEYKPDYELGEVNTPETAGGVTMPTIESGKWINDEAQLKAAIEESGLTEDILDESGRTFYTQISKLGESAQFQEMLEEAMRNVGQMQDSYKSQFLRAARKAHRFHKANNPFLTADSQTLEAYAKQKGVKITNKAEAIEHAARQLIDSALVEPVSPASSLSAKMNPNKDPSDLLRDDLAMTDAGEIAFLLMRDDISVQLMRQASRVTDLLDKGIASQKELELFVSMVDSANLFFVPYERSGRKFASLGNNRQPKKIAAALSPEGIAKAAKAADSAADAEYLDITRILVDGEEGPGKPLVELYDLFLKGGAEGAKAGETLHAFIRAVATGDTTTASSKITNLGRTMRDQLKKGNVDARRNLFYSDMITRIAPQAASFASNLVNIMIEPTGHFFRGDFARVHGQIIGAVSSWDEIFHVMKKAYKTGQTPAHGNKLMVDIRDRKLKDMELERTWKGVQDEWERDGVGMRERVNQTWWYLTQKVSNLPGMRTSARALTAGDAVMQMTYGTQQAMGRAFAEIGAMKVKPKKGSPEFKAIIDKHMQDVFIGGVKTGQIKDPEVIAGSRRLTFQSDIPEDGNAVDNMFLAAQNAADTSAWFSWASPFTRIGYNTAEGAGRLMAGALDAPFLPIDEIGKRIRGNRDMFFRPGSWLLTRIPRYQAIITGKHGETAQLQLQAQIAFGQAWALKTAGMSAAGLVTGQNPPPGMPRTSYIIPMFGAPKGYVAVPYGKVEPAATPTAIIADLVRAVLDESISQKQYDRAVTQVLQSIAVSVLDKSFLSGIQRQSDLMSLKNWQFNPDQVIAQLTRPVPGQIVGGYSGAGRMVLDWLNPYETVNRTEVSEWNAYWAQFRASNLSGAGNPVLYNPFSGKPETKVANLTDDKGYWHAVLSTMVNEFVSMGRSKSDYQDKQTAKIYKEFDKLGFEPDIRSTIRSYKGVFFSLDQQSKLSKDMHDVGKLKERLHAYLTTSSRYKDYLSKWESFESDYGHRGKDTRSDKYLSQIKSDIRAIISQAKEVALKQGSLSKDAELQNRIWAVENNAEMNLQSEASEIPEVIQNILSIPV